MWKTSSAPKSKRGRGSGSGSGGRILTDEHGLIDFACTRDLAQLQFLWPENAKCSRGKRTAGWLYGLAACSGLCGVKGSVQHHCDRDRDRKREGQPRGDKFIGIGTMLKLLKCCWTAEASSLASSWTDWQTSRSQPSSNYIWVQFVWPLSVCVCVCARVCEWVCVWCLSVCLQLLLLLPSLSCSFALLLLPHLRLCLCVCCCNLQQRFVVAALNFLLLLILIRNLQSDLDPEIHCPSPQPLELSSQPGSCVFFQC